jgi:hypothetical protein
MIFEQNLNKACKALAWLRNSIGLEDNHHFDLEFARKK